MPSDKDSTGTSLQSNDSRQSITKAKTTAMNIIKPILILSLGFLALSCQELNEGNGQIEVSPESTLTPVISSAGGTAEITFTTNCDWTANVPDISSYSWSSITPTSGSAGENVITVTALRNDGYDDRSFTFDIKAGGAIETVNVTQKQKNSLTVTSGSFDMPEEGGEVRIEVIANVEYEYSIEEAAKSWITAAPASKALETTEILFNVAPAEDFENTRTGHIYVTSGDITETITVTQEAKTRVFEVSPQAIDIDKNGGEVSFTVNSNFAYQVAEIQSDWISLKSSDDGTYIYEVDENATMATRSASVAITTDVEGYGATVTFTQTGIAEVKVLWTKTFASYSKTLSAPIIRFAEAGDYLLVSTGSSVFAVDRLTGEYLMDINIPEGLKVESLTNDDAGNIIFAANAAYGSTFNVYTMKSLTDSPQLVLSYEHNSIYSSSMGNLRVRGDVLGKAAVTASVDVSQYWVAWQVENGTVSEEFSGAAPAGGSTVWNPQSLCTAPVSDDLSDGLLYIGYTGDYSLQYCGDCTQNTWKSIYATGSAGNENYNCLSTAEFGGASYVAYGSGAHFSYGACPEAHLIDITDMSDVHEIIMIPASDITGGASFTGVGASSDILLTVPGSGDTMYMYVADGNYDCLACISISLP